MLSVGVEFVLAGAMVSKPGHLQRAVLLDVQCFDIKSQEYTMIFMYIVHNISQDN